MKQLFWIALLGLGLYYYLGEDAQEQQQEAGPAETVPVEKVTSIDAQSERKIADGVEKVLGVLDELVSIVTNQPNQTETINKLGKNLSEKWDKIEKSVETNFPDEYKNIEDSLYPLIAYAQNQTPDIEQIKQLSSEVKEKLTAFKQKLSS
ncbi:hypothetical protein ERJ70_06645 [Sediminibacillus dalangtanensis]|uniref:Sporulation lipoprotein YhcN/YlaJ (Spore_YhcN_YlaJ) n=1 Tax=Sediminibacillus dalangtanensis TaxID=2729421 RepID=A0ABX7VSM6_9BACI|nr:hypothetical protein [Sediminibacillus dalangtanensis]QTM99009.1 hypothetical protein ERJ70_06645 [Sediminibacillus dalangtanensis]